MNEIVVYLFDVDEFDRNEVENATYEQLESMFEKADEGCAQKCSLKAFQYAFNEEQAGESVKWVRFIEKKVN